MPPPRTQARYDTANLQAALIIADDLQRFPEGSLARRWAERVIARLTSPPNLRTDERSAA